MSTCGCELHAKGRVLDDNCIVGFDEAMATFFFQSGEEDDQGTPLIWMGQRHRQFTTLTSLIIRFKRLGYNLKIHPEDMAELKQYDQPTFLQKLFGLA